MPVTNEDMLRDYFKAMLSEHFPKSSEKNLLEDIDTLMVRMRRPNPSARRLYDSIWHNFLFSGSFPKKEKFIQDVESFLPLTDTYMEDEPLPTAADPVPPRAVVDFSQVAAILPNPDGTYDLVFEEYDTIRVISKALAEELLPAFRRYLDTLE